MNFKERYKYNSKTDLLGKGGFAKVYKASDTLLERTVALKFFINDGNDKHTLIREISKAISLEHPNLCRYYDAAIMESVNLHDETEKTEIGVMEYLDGGDLRTFINHHPSYLDKLLVDVLNGLTYLHNNGIIHRDLKPQNILIKKTGGGPVAKITDFGISKMMDVENNTSRSALLGSIEYMAPEQFNPEKFGINGRISSNLDLWSFGCLVYELVAGESLFGSPSGNTRMEQVMSNILNQEATTEKTKFLPEPYKTIIQKCLSLNANDRVKTAEEIINLLMNKEKRAVTQIKESVNTDYETRIIVPVIEKEKPVIQKELPPIVNQQKQRKTIRNYLLLISLAVIIGGGITIIFLTSKNNNNSSRNKIGAAFHLDSASKSNEDNVRAMIQSLNDRNFDEYEKYISTSGISYVYKDTSFFSSISSDKKFFEEWSAAFPDYKINLMSIHADKDSVIVYFTESGTFKNEYIGIKPNNNYFEVQNKEVIKFDLLGKMKSVFQTADWPKINDRVLFSDEKRIMIPLVE